MTNFNLIKRLSRQFPCLTLSESKEIIDLFLEAMKEGLKIGDIVEVRDFGVLRIRSRTSKKARNPRTGEKVVVGGKKVPYFKQSRVLKGNLHENEVVDK